MMIKIMVILKTKEERYQKSKGPFAS